MTTTTTTNTVAAIAAVLAAHRLVPAGIRSRGTFCVTRAGAGPRVTMTATSLRRSWMARLWSG